MFQEEKQDPLEVFPFSCVSWPFALQTQLEKLSEKSRGKAGRGLPVLYTHEENTTLWEQHPSLLTDTGSALPHCDQVMPHF